MLNDDPPTGARDDARITAWCGDYRFGRDESYFPEAVALARKYADREPDRRPSEACFEHELEALRAIASAEGAVLLGQTSHRWRHPDCPPSLYVLTCVLCAPLGGSLVAEDGSHVQRLQCTKVGQAKRTVAARIERYRRDALGGVAVAHGSQSLRIVIYGDGSTMLLERDIQEVARRLGSRAEVINEAGVRRRVGSETYVGVEIVDALSAFARECADEASDPPEGVYGDYH